MPQYEFRCKKCNKEFNLFMSISERERKKITCPSCKGRSVEQLITPFMTKTSRKS
jgi:putative FmdB family regulatory protein